MNIPSFLCKCYLASILCARCAIHINVIESESKCLNLWSWYWHKFRLKDQRDFHQTSNISAFASSISSIVRFKTEFLHRIQKEILVSLGVNNLFSSKKILKMYWWWEIKFLFSVIGRLAQILIFDSMIRSFLSLSLIIVLNLPFFIVF